MSLILHATAVSETEVLLSWSAVADSVGAGGFEILRGGEAIATTEAREYTDSGLAPESSHEYQVLAFDRTGKRSSASAVASVTTPRDTQAPTEPDLVRAVATAETRAELSWHPSRDNVAVTGYRVYRDGVLVAEPTQTAHVDEGLAAGRTYAYEIRAVDAAGNESTGSPHRVTTLDLTPPTVPTNVVATPISETEIMIAATMPTDNVGVAGCKIYRDGVQIATTPETAHVDTGLQPGTTYAYQLLAFDAAGNESGLSEAATATTLRDSEPPTEPRNLAVTVVASTQTDLTWEPSQDNVAVAGYRVYRDGTLVGEAPKTAYSDRTVSAGERYLYEVRAFDAAGNLSSASEAVEIEIPDWSWISGPRED